MDLKTLRSELRKLSALAEGWDTPENIAGIERDLALEKLRELYDMLRFDVHPAVAEPNLDDMPLGIDLDEVLSLGLIPDAKEDDADLEPQAAAVSAEAPVPSAVSVEVSVLSAMPVPGISAEPAPVPSAVVSFVPELGTAPSAEFASASAAEFVTELEVVSEPAADPIFEVVSTPEPVPRPNPAPASQPMLASLFGADDEELTARHRRKQRVIMSLYGRETPIVNPAAAVSAEPDEEFEEFSVQTVSVSEMPGSEAEPAGDIAPDDESFGGEEPAPEEPAELDDPTLEAPVEAENALEPAVGPVLGEVMNHQVRTLSDAYAAHPDTLSEAAHHAPIGDLRSVIGLNDRFLLIRDLFDDDAAACDAALAAFNGFEGLDDCMIHIAENYSWNPESDGAKFLMDLLERKFA